VSGHLQLKGIVDALLLIGLGAQACVFGQALERAPVLRLSAGETGGRGYVLGPNDEISVQALHVPEMDGKPIRVDSSGAIQLPLIGRVEVNGLSVEELRARIREGLDRYVKEPEASVEIVAFRSQPITVMGSVKNPGVYYLQGPTDLATVLSLAGGLAPEAADLAQLKRDRGCGADLPGAREEAGARLMATVRVSELMGSGESGNVLVCPNDVVSVPRARLIYVLGEVRKPGGFPLRDGESMSVLQALALAEGPASTAGVKHARLLRAAAGSKERPQQEIDLNQLLTGHQPDLPLLADDILFLPNSASKSAAIRALEAAIQTGTGIAIWRR
jgi:polysaccharide export outer membrane protein